MRELLGRGEVAVIGLGRSGTAVARLLKRAGGRVYASDRAGGPGPLHEADVLRGLGIDAQAGGHDDERIARAALVVVSPGVPPDAAPLMRARERGVPIVSEVEVALEFLPATRVIAVTGTNGKSTVTALIDHLLRALGLDSVAAGNIGLALSEIALRPVPPALVSLELSSFQLHDTPGLDPAVGVVTNLAPDHLDRYPSVDAYYADKALLWRNARESSAWVTNADDAELQRRSARVPGRHLRFSLHDSSADAGPAAAGQWQLLGQALIAQRDIPLLGLHNVANVLAAALAVAVVAPIDGTGARAALVAGIRSFPGLPHRLETVAEVNGVVWINDSKATNVSSARVAIEGMVRPAIVLLGGKHKGEPYTGLLPALRDHAKMVIAYGESAPLIEADLRALAGTVPLVRLGSSFEDVMARARAAAEPGDAVLLSPACSSYDMFANYEERGALFRRLAQLA
jgi:UDP-N-acetylmuramoylalanine--D-glutamate ligase